MSNNLDPGQVRAGLLIDGVDGTPYQPCTLTHEVGDGPLLAVPFVRGDPQFDAPHSWFRDMAKPPATLLFQDADGPVTLTGLRWRGHRGDPVSVGRLDARIAILAQPRQLQGEYRIRSVLSDIDGLHEFADFNSVSTDYEANEGRLRVHVVVEAKDKIEVEHGNFTLAIRATAPWSVIAGSHFTARANAAIESTSQSGATIDDHIVAQWPVRALLILAFGTSLRWRGHQLRDDQFPLFMLSGDAREAEYVPLLYRRTLEDHQEPEPDRLALVQHMFRLNDLGAEGLHRWLRLYSDPVFRRAVEPAVEVLNGATRFVEPRLTMAVFALEAMGHFLDENRRAREPMHRHIVRCLDAASLDLSALGTPSQVASALANINNDAKHADRPIRPDGVEMGLAASLAMIILRLQLFELLDLDIGLRDRFLRLNPVRHAIEAFELNSVGIVDDRFKRLES